MLNTPCYRRRDSSYRLLCIPASVMGEYYDWSLSPNAGRASNLLFCFLVRAAQMAMVKALRYGERGSSSSLMRTIAAFVVPIGGFRRPSLTFSHPFTSHPVILSV